MLIAKPANYKKILNASRGKHLPMIEEIKDLFPDLNLTKENLEENREAIFSDCKPKLTTRFELTEKKYSK